MADSELSASELRKRYMRGGTLGDDELTSAQLRARHAIPSNSKGLYFKIYLIFLKLFNHFKIVIDFSSGSSSSKGDSGAVIVVAAVLLLVVVAVVFFFMNSQS